MFLLHLELFKQVPVQEGGRMGGSGPTVLKKSWEIWEDGKDKRNPIKKTLDFFSLPNHLLCTDVSFLELDSVEMEDGPWMKIQKTPSSAARTASFDVKLRSIVCGNKLHLMHGSCKRILTRFTSILLLKLA